MDRVELAQDLAETEPDEAMRLCNSVLNEDHNHQQALFIAGYICLKAERFGMAYSLLQKCAALNPDKSEIENNMGMCLEYMDPEGAMSHFERALELKPENHHAMINKALSLLRIGDPKGCIEWCTKALWVNKEAIGAYDNRAYGHLMLRNWSQGWKDYRWSMGHTRQERDYGLKTWNGSPGQVVVYGEQGLGDEILFASCIPDLMKKNEVIIDCDPRLEGVFKRSFDCPVYGTRFSEQTPILNEYNPKWQIAVGELPRFFRNRDKDFPGTAFLTPDPERCVQWRALLDDLPWGSNDPVMRRNQPNGKRIGLAWTGGLPNTLKDQRSFSLDVFAPLFELPHTFVSLEYEEPDTKGYPIKHWGRAVNRGVDYDETLALMNELDLVISVTTTAVHAAGALGKECWCLVPKYPSYRFHLDGGIPWHNSVELFRQKDDWESLILEIKGRLETKWLRSSSVSMSASR